MKIEELAGSSFELVEGLGRHHRHCVQETVGLPGKYRCSHDTTLWGCSLGSENDRPDWGVPCVLWVEANEETELSGAARTGVLTDTGTDDHRDRHRASYSLW